MDERIKPRNNQGENAYRASPRLSTHLPDRDGEGAVVQALDSDNSLTDMAASALPSQAPPLSPVDVDGLSAALSVGSLRHPSGASSPASNGSYDAMASGQPLTVATHAPGPDRQLGNNRTTRRITSDSRMQEPVTRSDKSEVKRQSDDNGVMRTAPLNGDDGQANRVTLERIKQHRSIRSLHSLKHNEDHAGQAQTARKRRLKVDNERTQMTGWQRRLHKIRKVTRALKAYHTNGFFNIWTEPIKKIEGRFGAGVASYFVLLKWLFLLNLMLAMLWIGSIMSVHIASWQDHTVINGAFTNHTIYDVYYSNRAWKWGVSGASSFFNGTGQYSNIFLFYQSYYPIMLNGHFRMDLAFVIVYFVAIALSFLAVLRKMRHEYVQKAGVSAGISGHDACPFSSVAFSSFNHTIAEASVRQHQRTAISTLFKMLLTEEEVAARALLLHQRARLLVYGRRAAGNLASVLILCLVAWVVYESVRACNSPLNNFLFNIMELVRQNPNDTLDAMCKSDPTGKTATPFPPYLVTAFNAILPAVFSQIAKFEQYVNPQWETRMTLARTYVIKVISIYILLYAVANALFNPQTPLTGCWEHDTATRFYTLLWLELLSTSGLNIASAIFRRYVWGGYEFAIRSRILQLVYRQGLIWFGMLYAPIVPTIGTLASFATFYVEWWTVHTFAEPPKRVFNTYSQVVWFLLFTLATLILVIVPALIAVTVVKPSTTCGPYRDFPGYNITFTRGQGIYYVIPKSIDAMHDSNLKSTLGLIGSITVIGPLLAILSLWIYWLRANGEKREQRLQMLEREIKEEREDKKNLIRFYGVQL